MKIFFALSVILALISVEANVSHAQNSVSETETQDVQAAQLTRALAKSIPNDLDWSVSYQPQFSLIEITRNEPILSEPLHAIFNANPSAESTKTWQILSFALRVRPYVSPSQYAVYKAQNAQTRAQLRDLEFGMKGISRKFDSFLPRTPAEKTQVARYEKLKKSLHDLPDFYFGKLSVDWMTYGDARDAFREAGQLPHFARGRDSDWSGPLLERKKVALALSKTLSRYEISSR